ncbi:hypothetical protein N752_27595 [Desulforamulus aquiferis]|nr:hypothetical protein N752_27595 [Desulforamulus aquiferis]
MTMIQCSEAYTAKCRFLFNNKLPEILPSLTRHTKGGGRTIV